MIRAVAVLLCCSCAPSGRGPNVVLIVVDALRASSLGIYNQDSPVLTPAFDRLAARGAVFERAQSPENWTKPATASILTGLYPATHRTKRKDSVLPDGATLLSEMLAGQSFTTGAFVGNPFVRQVFGFYRGWDSFRYLPNTDAALVFAWASRWIKRNRDRRFFAYIHTMEPHVPYAPPPDLADFYTECDYVGLVNPQTTHRLLDDIAAGRVSLSSRDRDRLLALYRGEVTYHDEWLAEFLFFLEFYRLSDNTIIVVTADHGEEIGDRGRYGHGHSLYQELLHVPLVIAGPGVEPQRVARTVGTVDIMPTVLALAGVEAGAELDGRDLFDETPRPVFSEFLDSGLAVVDGDMKLVRHGGREQLFDLGCDPDERTPVADDAEADRLRGLLDAHSRRRGLDAVATDLDEETAAQLASLGYF